jgi:hypothetical protein
MTDAIKAVAYGLPGRAERTKRTLAPRAASSMSNAVKLVGSRKRNPPATREGRKGIVIYLEPEVVDAIKRLAVALDNATLQVLGEHAFKLLFRKYREPWPGMQG